MRSRDERRIINSLHDTVRLDIARCEEIASFVVELKRLKALSAKMRKMQIDYNQGQEEHAWLERAIIILETRIEDYARHAQESVDIISE